ncbi:hypothetical protein BJ170DRAFT_129855 [Xylariales sp. AK1849]|nr:hypothetical protein BJ170DRAFT_129855 [Xylariales sp. AK1849]
MWSNILPARTYPRSFSTFSTTIPMVWLSISRRGSRLGSHTVISLFSHSHKLTCTRSLFPTMFLPAQKLTEDLLHVGQLAPYHSDTRAMEDQLPPSPDEIFTDPNDTMDAVDSNDKSLVPDLVDEKENKPALDNSLSVVADPPGTPPNATMVTDTTLAPTSDRRVKNASSNSVERARRRGRSSPSSSLLRTGSPRQRTILDPSSTYYQCDRQQDRVQLWSNPDFDFHCGRWTILKWAMERDFDIINFIRLYHCADMVMGTINWAMPSIRPNLIRMMDEAGSRWDGDFGDGVVMDMVYPGLTPADRADDETEHGGAGEAGDVVMHYAGSDDNSSRAEGFSLREDKFGLVDAVTAQSHTTQGPMTNLSGDKPERNLDRKAWTIEDRDERLKHLQALVAHHYESQRRDAMEPPTKTCLQGRKKPSSPDDATVWSQAASSPLKNDE